jgi:site-specific recombinase XerD
LPTDDERVRATVRGIRRSPRCCAQQEDARHRRARDRNAPLAGTRLSSTRDRALLLIGFAGAFRRSELVALNLEDIEETAEGLRVAIRRSKTDREGHRHAA